MRMMIVQPIIALLFIIFFTSTLGAQVNYRFILLPADQCHQLSQLMTEKMTVKGTAKEAGKERFVDVKQLVAQEQLKSLITCSVEGLLLHQQQWEQLQQWERRQQPQHIDPSVKALIEQIQRQWSARLSLEEQLILPLMRLRELLLYQPYRGQKTDPVYRMMVAQWKDIPPSVSLFLAQWLTHPQATLEVAKIFLRPKALKKISLVAIGMQMILFFVIIFAFRSQAWPLRLILKTVTYIVLQLGLLIYIFAVFQNELSSTKEILLSDRGTTHHLIAKPGHALA